MSITNLNRLNDLWFIDNYYFYIHNNDINNIKKHNNNNNFITHMLYFSVLYIGPNPIMHNNNNILIELVNTMEQSCVTSMRK